MNSTQGNDMDRIKTAITRAKKDDIDKEHIRAAERKLAKLVPMGSFRMNFLFVAVFARLLEAACIEDAGSPKYRTAASGW